MKKKYIILSASLIGMLVLILTFSFANNSTSKTKNTNNVAEASEFKEVESVTKEDAQKLINFKLIIPKSLKSFKDPVIVSNTPPTGAIQDLKKSKKFKRIESYYESKTNKNEGIIFAQTNHEIQEMDALSGEPLKAETLQILGQNINHFKCDCDPSSELYWWFDGKIGTEIKIIGEFPKEEIDSFLKEIISGRIQ